MIALRIEFVAGQFHANPWNSASNKDETEWPPAPWRLLRAIVAGWHEHGAEEPETLLRVLDALAQCPVFDLPRVSSGHTRHCVAHGELRKSEPKGSLMLDSFIALEPEREHRAHAYAIWPTVTLTADERRVLEACCAAIRNFGSRESSCAVAAVNEVPQADGRFRVDLATRDSSEGPSVRRLAPMAAYRGEALLRALDESKGALHHRRRSTPLGACWVEYRMPLDFGWVAEQALQRDIRRAVVPPVVMRFAVDRVDGDGRLPSITNAVIVAEKVRQAVLKRHSDMNGTPASKRLAGKQHDGSERRQGHDHPFF